MESTVSRQEMPGRSQREPERRQREYEIIASRESRQDWLSRTDPYSAALAFVRGEIDVAGDLVAAVRDQVARAGSGWHSAVLNWIGRLAPWRLAELWENRTRAAQHIRFHYDRSNSFYREFLDSRMVYSCAYFRHPGDSLDEAQLAKLDHICRKLRLRGGERFLDVGCGWGALVLHAARRYGALATGCTLSRRQAEYACAETSAARLDSAVSIHETDYRDLNGRFDKIASVGMFEHVGGYRMRAYFKKIYDLLQPGGLFLNHGITRPGPVHSDAQTAFIARRVFPGGRIVGLTDVVDAAEHAGFEVLDVENLRRHYALTCRAWVARLRAHRDACLRSVDPQSWRTWQLFLAGSAVAFEEGSLGLHQVLLAKRGSPTAPMTREYMYPHGAT
jgi:cyclopropane-fatty-acyl-phospholipid synthase